MPWNQLADELVWDDVGGRLLANLALGIYSHEAVLREYVQNAADAYKALDFPADDQSIVISPDGNDLCIQDSGVGMDERDIRYAKKIAVSTKAELEEMVGFRGIGIWAGFQACERLIIDSTKQGDPRRYRLTIEFADILKHVDDNINIKELVDSRYQLEYTDAERDEHYTRVTLKNVHDEYKKLLDEKELTRIVSQVLPSRIDQDFQYYQELQRILEKWPLYHEFPIKIRTGSGLKEVFRSFPGQQQLEPPQEKIIESDEGIELGRVWYCRTKTTSRELKETFPAIRGFRMRVRNFAVGRINIYDDPQGYTYGIQINLTLRTTARLNWFCGEMHVTN